MRSCETHGEGTENGKDYTVVDLAYWFHSLPHLKFTFRPIENTMFNFGDPQYHRSIAFFAILTLICCVIVIILYIIFSFLVYKFCSRDKTNDKKQDKEKAKKKSKDDSTGEERTGIATGWRIFLFLLSIVCAFSFLIGCYGVWRVYVGLGSLRNSSQDGVNWFKAIKDDFGEADLLNSFDHFKGMVQSLREEITAFGLIPNVLNKFTDILDKIVDYLDQTNEQVIKANVPLFNLSRIDVQWIPEDIDSYGNIVCEVFLAVITIITITGLLFTCGIFHSYLLAIFTLIGIIGIILNAFLLSAALSGTVFVSDFCVDAKPFIKYLLNEWILYKYLVECPIEKGSPITGLLQKAGGLITTIKGSYKAISSALIKIINLYCNTTDKIVDFGIAMLRNIPLVNQIELPQNMSITCPANIKNRLTKVLTGLTSKLSSYTQLVNTLKSMADCNRINKDLYDSLNSICGEINPGVNTILFFSAFSFICLSIIVFCATFALIRTPTKLKKNSIKRFQKNKNIKNNKNNLK